MLIFEHGALYNVEGELADDAGAGRHRPRRGPPARARTSRSIAYGGTLGQGARRRRAARRPTASTAEVIDLRTLRPLDERHRPRTRCARTHRAVVVDEGWRTRQPLGRGRAPGSPSSAFYDLDAPVARVCSAEVPMPYARHLEEAALPSAERVVGAVREMVGDG